MNDVLEKTIETKFTLSQSEKETIERMISEEILVMREKLYKAFASPVSGSYRGIILETNVVVQDK